MIIYVYFCSKLKKNERIKLAKLYHLNARGCLRKTRYQRHTYSG